MSDAERPKRFGKCVVEREIGRGARAIVYLARHEGLQIPVALKVMRKEMGAEEEQFAERFMREARLTAQLNHSNIVRVYDCGETEDSYYLILEYIEGNTCKDRLREQGAFEWQRAVRIIHQVADGLGYANKKGIIHRDLKPENIMIDAEGNAHLADLGLAKQIVTEQASATVDGDVLGTPYYMSPEQVRQPGSVDFRADIYSLGATLYHMATGEVPFEANTPFEIMTRHLSAPLTPPEERKADLPPALSGIIMRMMAKEPQDRYQSYHELIQELDALLGGEAEQPGRAGAAAAAAKKARGAGEAALEAGAAGPEVAEEPAVGLQAPGREGPAARPPVRLEALPVTVQNVQAKLLGMLSLLGYAFFLVCLHQLLSSVAGLPVALAVLIALIAAWIGWGRFVLRRRGVPQEGEEPEPVSRQVSDALAGLCERLSLPLVRVCPTNCEDDVCYAYSFFSRSASLHVPFGWLRKAGLNDQETEAYLAQALGGLFGGDSDLRTLLGVPIGLLAGGRWLGERALKVLSSADSRARLRFAQLFALVAVVGACTLAAALFFLSFWAGALGLLFFGSLVLLSGFERYCRCAGDAFAARVMGSRSVVSSVIIASGLSGVERYGLVHECVGEFEAQRWAAEVPPPDVRRRWVRRIAAHYAEMEYAPGTLETARKLFCTAPLAAERLNRLAGVPRRRPTSVRAVDLTRRVFARLLGVRGRRPMAVAELGATGLPALLGVFVGLLVVGATVVLFLRGAAYYPFFLLVTAVLGAALGVVLSWHGSIGGLSAAKVGWKITVAGVLLVCTGMLAFCLVGLRDLAPFALQVPVYLPLVLLAAGGAGAVFSRLMAVVSPEFAPEGAVVVAEAQAPPAAGPAAAKRAPRAAAAVAPSPVEEEAAAGKPKPAAEPPSQPRVSASPEALEGAGEEQAAVEVGPAEEGAPLEEPEPEAVTEVGPQEPAEARSQPEDEVETVAELEEATAATEFSDTHFGLDQWPPRGSVVEAPPAETPPAETPLAEGPAAPTTDQSAAEAPPTEAPPTEALPTEEPPADQ